MEYIAWFAVVYVTLGLIVMIIQLKRKPLSKRLEQTASENPDLVVFSSKPKVQQVVILAITITFLWPVELYLSVNGKN